MPGIEHVSLTYSADCAQRNSRSCLVRGLMAAILVMAAAFAWAAPAPPADTAPKAIAAPRQLPVAGKKWAGDFDQMLERRTIRMLVPYSRTLFYNDKGRERGIAAELGREFERYMNLKYSKTLNKRPLTLYLIPVTRDELFKGLISGEGDIAAGNITVTPERSKLVDFAVVDPTATLSEIIVTGPKAPPINTVNDLSGKTVDVRVSTSYYQSLLALNARFKREGRAPVKIVALPDALEDEDKLEMVNAGLLNIVVVDDWIAKIWGPVLPKITLHNDIKLREGAHVGWAMRQHSPQLQAAVNDFFVNHVKKQGGIAYRVAMVTKRVKQFRDSSEAAEWKRFEDTLALFQKYGSQYGFDPLLLAAQGYQESQLNQNAKSHVGAIGIMQIMPATGKELQVGNIRIAENNVQGGAKYMDQLMTRYFKDAHFDETDRSLFAFAAYNAGPGNIAKMRTEAAKRGLDPNKWFNNVEIVVAEKVGVETTTYVRNIYKYYVAYTLALEAQNELRKARARVVPGTR
jgi:membrane-bound lytic murein transglycosylase MltF